MNRRTFLHGGVAATSAALAGCTEVLSADSSHPPPILDDRPERVYHPSHRDTFVWVGSDVEAGPYGLSLAYSLPNRYWRVEGSETTAVSVRDEDSIHLLVSVWNRTLLTEQRDDPTDAQVFFGLSDAEVTVRKDGKRVTKRSLTRLLAQDAGVYYGANLTLEGAGTYQFQFSLGPVETEGRGGFADRFHERRETTARIEFEPASLTFERTTEAAGTVDALESPALAGVPDSGRFDYAPDAPERTTRTDAGVPVTAKVTSAPAFLADDEQYLVVYPTTPLNGYLLPSMSMDATATLDGATLFDGALTPALHPELGYHYGTRLPATDETPSVTVDVTEPPQVARGEGYETAFFGTPTLSFF